MEEWMLYAILATVVALATSWFLRPKVTQGKGQAAAPPTQVAKVVTPPAKPKKEFYTVEEVAQHSSSDDCWIIIEDKVYDVTSYVNEHPGGDAILNNAGADSTTGFLGDQHPIERVREMIEEFYVGKLQRA